jgi:hypothetical protein
MDSNFREAMISFCCSPAAEITVKSSQARKRQKSWIHLSQYEPGSFAFQLGFTTLST